MAILNACVKQNELVEETICKECKEECSHAGEPTTEERLQRWNQVKPISQESILEFIEMRLEERIETMKESESEMMINYVSGHIDSLLHLKGLILSGMFDKEEN